jgi:hypothetical protein
MSEGQQQFGGNTKPYQPQMSKPMNAGYGPGSFDNPPVYGGVPMPRAASPYNPRLQVPGGMENMPGISTGKRDDMYSPQQTGAPQTFGPGSDGYGMSSAPVPAPAYVPKIDQWSGLQEAKAAQYGAPNTGQGIALMEGYQPDPFTKPGGTNFAHGAPTGSPFPSVQPGSKEGGMNFAHGAPSFGGSTMPFAAPPAAPAAPSVDMSGPYGPLRAAAAGVPYVDPNAAPTPNAAPAPAPGFTPIRGGAQTPPPPNMQPGQARWDWNNSFGGGNQGWTPVYKPSVWDWANNVMNPNGRPAPWASRVDPNNFLQSVGDLSGMPFAGSMWDR